MKINVENFEVVKPKNQLSLHGYEKYFDIFVKLYQKNKLPNTILISGPKGLGKSTFIYHFINFLFSINEEKKYSINDLSINPENKSYKLISNNIHPNFFLLDNFSKDESIKIAYVNNLLKFLNKTTYLLNKKIILIDNSEYLNLSASNALLKALEEPNSDTYFFIIHNNSSQILDTIKSRSIVFNFSFTDKEKGNIFEKITKEYKLELDIKNLTEYLYFDTPGNLLKCLSTFNNSDIDITNNKFSCITYLIKKYISNKNIDFLTMATFFVELFYNELSSNNSRKINNYFFNKCKILNLFNDMKIFNLDKKSLSVTLYSILENEN